MEPIDKGEFVTKWIISFHQDLWSFSIQIPAIDLTKACDLEEQRAIYQKFHLTEQGASKRSSGKHTPRFHLKLPPRGEPSSLLNKLSSPRGKSESLSPREKPSSPSPREKEPN